MQCKKTALRVLSTAAFMAMISSCVTPVFADTWFLEDGNITVTAKDSGQTVEQGGTKKDDDNPTITQYIRNEPTDKTVTINAEAGAKANVTLDDVNIKTSGSSSPVDVKGEGTTEIEIDGTVTLDASGTSDPSKPIDKNNPSKGNAGVAALHKGEDGELVIKDGNSNGNIIATGGKNAAGIGSNSGEDAKDITIDGGDITAKTTTDSTAAGIGSGTGGDAEVTITGGTINAAGGSDPSTSANVKAHAGAGIGSGAQGDAKVTITGGTINATGGSGNSGGSGGAGIGSGNDGNANVTITGGESITATGGTASAGIGTGAAANTTTTAIVNISGGTITKAEGGSTGIGSGSYGNAEVKIRGDAEIDEAIGKTGAGIGGGGSYGTDRTTVTISGDATVEKAIGGDYSAGIGGGMMSGKTTVTISGNAKIENTTGGVYGAGIGSGWYSIGETEVDISGGTVTATGGKSSAGIGSGYYAGEADVDISGGTVTATGGESAPGIGAGAYNTVKGTVDITGGTITATAGANSDETIGAIGSSKNSSGTQKGTEVTIDSEDDDLDVTAITANEGSAVVSQEDSGTVKRDAEVFTQPTAGSSSLFDAVLDNTYSGIVKFVSGGKTYKAVHNEKYASTKPDAETVLTGEVKNAHDWGENTSTEDGKYHYECKEDGCGATADVEYVKDTDAKCETDETGHYKTTVKINGTVAYTNVGDADSVTKQNTKTEHSWGEPTYAWNNGELTATFTCANDKSHTHTETVTGTYKKDTDATCTQNETGHYEAAVTYNKTYDTQSTAANSVEKPNTKLNHDYGTSTPRFTWSGNQLTGTITCSRNDETLTDTKTGTYVKDADATCTSKEKGHYEATVTLNGVNYTESSEQFEVGEALGHKWVTDKAVDAACESTGLTEGKHCSVCGYAEIQAITPATGHDWGEWETTTPATCETDGVQTRTCKNDPSHTETRKLDKLGHDIVKDAAKAATCTETGLTEGEHCSRGDYTKAQEVVAAKGHDWGEWETTTPATCETDGVQTRTCKNDPSHTETRAISKLGHAYGEWVVTKEATCSEAGEKARTCANDASHVEKETIPATGEHSWGEWVYGENIRTRTCTHCGKMQAEEWKKDEGKTEEAKQGEYSTYLVVLDNIRMDITADTAKVTMTQVDSTLYVNANGQDVAYLEGNIVELEKLQAQGVQSIVFATASHTTAVNIADIMACGSDDEVFCISHNGGNASLTVAGAAHNELLK